MKTICPPDYHHNSFVATHGSGHVIQIHVYIYESICIYIYIYETWKAFQLCVYIVKTKIIKTHFRKSDIWLLM